MTDVRLTATNPEDSSVVPVACDASGRLLLEEQGQGPPGPEGPPGPKGDDGDPFSGNFDGDVTFGGSGEFAGDTTSSLNGFDISSAASVGARLSPGGVILVKRGAIDTSKVFQGFGGTTETSTIESNGSGTFLSLIHI